MTAWTSSPISGRAAELLPLGARLIDAGRPGLHRRLQPLRGEARTAPRYPPVSVERRCRAFCAGAVQADARARDQAGVRPSHGSAFTAWSTSGWISICSPRLPTRRPDWRFVIVGPVVKISEADLPRRPNLHYLGGKPYAELPDYLARLGRRADAVRDQRSDPLHQPDQDARISGGGPPVVSTPIADVVRHYGDIDGGQIAATAGRVHRALRSGARAWRTATAPGCREVDADC